MSRRKQGRPQQRKALDSLEQENDLLLCGECQTSFPLQDILKFIRHKVNKCSKKIVDVLDPPEYEDGSHSDSDQHCGSISSKRTSISAPISLKEAIENNKSPRSSIDSLASLKDVRVKEENGHSPMDEDKVFEQKLPRSPLKPRKVVDAESNTTNTEPSKFVCDSCKCTFGSAWSLLQHAQKEHGMRIYTTSLDKQQKYPEQQHKKERDEREQHEHDREHRNHREHRHHEKQNSSPSNHKSQPTSLHPQQQQAPQLKQRDEQRDTPLLCQPLDPHRTPPSASSAGSADSGNHLLQDGGHHILPPHPSPHSNPFLFKFPFDRPPLSPGLPFCRPPSLGLDFPIVSEPSLPRSFVGFPPMFDGGPSPPFQNLFERPRQSPVGLDNQLESFYSQRLRQLASSTSGSPSPVRKQTPPFSQPGPSPTTFPPVTPPSSLSSDMEKPQHGSGSITPPAKLKSCEFCGKSFRFQSNLIVHRRSHTGEKPFKCTLCPHACTQQSKLKRHMKTHMNKSPLSASNASNMSNDGSLASGSSTPDSSKRYLDDEDEEEEEEEEEMEEEIEEEEEMNIGMDEAYKNSFKDSFKEDYKDGFNPPKKLEINSSPKSSELAARLLDPVASPENQARPREPERASPYADKTSLLSEVMKNTGLTNFPAYNEAFKQAMAERGTSPVGVQEERTSENGSNNSSNSSQDGMKEDSIKRSSSDSDSELPHGKKIKNEPVDPSSFPTNNMENHHIYSLWGSMGFPAPPPQDFHFLSLSGMQFDCAGSNHNGYSPSTPESALKSFNAQTPPKPGPSTPVSGEAAHMRKDRMRNDTCEFCGKVFKNCSNLTVHRRSHTGEKPYKCILCNYACAQSSKLTRHMKTHGRIGKDVYKCKFCLMPFSVPSTLEKHMRKCVENRTPGLIRETDSDSTSSNATTPTLNCQPGILQESSMDKSSVNVPINCAPGILQDASLDKNGSSTPNL